MVPPGLRILYFSRDYTTHDRRFLAALRDAGCVVYFLRWERGSVTYETRNVPEGVQVLDWKSSLRGNSTHGWLSRLWELKTIIRDVRPHVALAGPLQTGALLLAILGYEPMIAMSWGSDILVNADRNAAFRTMTKLTLCRSTGVLGDCYAVRQKVHSLVSYDDELIVTFPWGIDLDAFRPGPPARLLRTQLGWEEKVIFISTRNWEPGYAIDVLLKGFAALHKDRPEARLLLLGDGSEESTIRKLIADLALQSIIYAPGRVSHDHLPDYFRASDIYVSTVLSDGTSISLLEAMASGLPAIVTNAYGNLEWVRPGENGWLFDPGDSEDLAAVLVEAMSDRSRLLKYGQNNVLLAQERANWQRNFPQLIALIERVLPDECRA